MKSTVDVILRLCATLGEQALKKAQYARRALLRSRLFYGSILIPHEFSQNGSELGICEHRRWHGNLENNQYLNHCTLVMCMYLSFKQPKR